MTDPVDQLNPPAEERYLASLLLAATLRDLRDEALATIEPDDFFDGRYGGLWAAARDLGATGRRITHRELVAAALAAGGRGIEQTLTELGALVPRAVDFPAAIAEVRRCGQLRRLVKTTIRIQQRAFIAEDYSQAVTWAHDELAKLDTADDTHDTRGYAQLLDDFGNAMRSRESYRIVATPWDPINERIAGGLHGGRLYIVGARPGEGKSIIGHNLAEHAASLGHPALVFSVEMGDLEVTGRMVANGATVEMAEISRRDLSARSWDQFAEYAARATSYPLFVNDRADLSLSYVKSECRAQKRRTGLDVVMIDYLQLLKSERNVPREQQVAHISRSLKELSRELDAAVIVPAQLNRQAVARDRPSLADLRESGSIEADADVVMLLARQHDDKGNANGLLGINLAKNRHGRIGELELPWRPHYSRIG